MGQLFMLKCLEIGDIGFIKELFGAFQGLALLLEYLGCSLYQKKKKKGIGAAHLSMRVEL